MSDLGIIFQDDYLMVISKPPGLVVDPSNTQKTGTLVDILKEEYGNNLERGGIVHRIDKDTSGILIVAKTEQSLLALQSQFQNRSVRKEYTTLVHGWIDKGGRVIGSIGRNPENREKFIVMEGGKEAGTEYEPVKLLVMSSSSIEKTFEGFSKIQLKKLRTMNYEHFTFLKCFPKTGRTHQIRVHLKYINFPIVSDEKYGGRKVIRLDKRWCKRMFLHASRIEFQHPKDGKIMVFECPLPKDLKSALSLLEKAS